MSADILKFPNSEVGEAQTDFNDPELEQTLAQRFGQERIGQLCLDYFTDELGIDVSELAHGREYLVAYIPADSKYSDIPRAVETIEFAEYFKLSKAEVLHDYGAYDAASTFVSVIDISRSVPVSAGVVRMVDYDPAVGFKDVNDLLVDDPKNPWIQEIKDGYFAKDEIYDPVTAWQRLGELEGVYLDLEDSIDVATHASAEAYRGRRGAINGVSMLFYHACLVRAKQLKKNNLLAIFDLPPLENLQQYGSPFNTYRHLSPHPYGGDGDTIPAFCDIKVGEKRMRKFDEGIGRVFIDGEGLDINAIMPDEYTAEQS